MHPVRHPVDKRLVQLERGMTESELFAEGWQRCFIADEPRLSEAVETYQEMGMEVALLPVDFDDRECSECMQADPDRFRVIYTRARDPEKNRDR